VIYGEKMLKFFKSSKKSKSMHGGKKYVIIGNGGAAFHCMRAIREIDQKNEITVIAEEDSPAYPPVLLPHYLAGILSSDEIYLCKQDFYEQNNIKVINNKAVGVDIKAKKVFLQRGGSVEYESLLIATGSIADIPAIEGKNIPGVFTFLRKKDAEGISSFLGKSKKIAIVGAGLIGIHTLGAFLEIGKEIILVEALDHILPHVIDKGAAEILQEYLRARGVEIYLGRKLIAIEERRGRKLLELSSGLFLEVDMVILSTGVKPNKDFLEGSGIRIDGGIAVDEYCRTNVEDVYAAGDVTESEDPTTGIPQIKATWINAAEQGRIAGLNMAGLKMANVRRPKMNISSIMDIPFAAIGVIEAKEDSFREIRIKNKDVYRKYIFDETGIAGAVLLGDISDAGVMANMMSRRELYKDVEEGLRRGNGFLPWIKQFVSLQGSVPPPNKSLVIIHAHEK